MLYLILLISCLVRPIASIPSFVDINGLIEGFYWTSSNAVQGQTEFYSKQQRDDLISSMGEGLNYYFFCPHETNNVPFTMALWNSQQLAEWTDTVSRAGNVSIVYGLRPQWIETLQTSLTAVKSKLAQLVTAGVRYYILCWDDTPGAGTDAQMDLQRQLIQALINQVTNIELIGVIPAYYARSQVGTISNTDWGNKLSILNRVSTNVRFFVTGTESNPSSIQPGDIPTLKNRRFIFFDNWIAVDANNRVTMTWPPNRSPSIYHANNKTISGGVLNLAFPPQRIIHQVFAMKQRVKNNYTNINSQLAADYWANYLVAKNFYDANSFAQLKTNLIGAMNDGYETISEINQYYPFLNTIFTN